MFANDYEWYLYGGLPLLEDRVTASPDNRSISTFGVYPSGSINQPPLGFSDIFLPTGITSYTAYGGYVSAPSENLGFYFGGLRAADFGPIYFDPINESVNADVESATFIQLSNLDMEPTWTNESVPSSVPIRADAQIVWLPISEQGILVAIGGVINPQYSNINQTDNSTIAIQSVSAYH
jgi:hypothetical protein